MIILVNSCIELTLFINSCEELSSVVDSKLPELLKKIRPITFGIS